MENRQTISLYIRNNNTTTNIPDKYDAVIDCSNNHIYVTIVQGPTFRSSTLEDAFNACAHCNNILYCYDDYSKIVTCCNPTQRRLAAVYIAYGKETASPHITIDEGAYISTLRNIIREPPRVGRNGAVRSMFGGQLQFDLTQRFPLLTVRKMFFRGIVEELLFFLSGNTDTSVLAKKGVRIWEKNTSAEFLTSRNLEYLPGDMGPMYGFQWLHYGADYKGCGHNYDGINQLQKCIDLLVTDPFSRRIIMTTYDPRNAEQGVLYPCHGLVVQFYVKEVVGQMFLSCHMYQRSADYVLGVPFNIASYALLTHIMCMRVNERIGRSSFVPDKLIMSFGDAHVYESHFAGVEQMLKRPLYTFPKLTIAGDGTRAVDFVLTDYIHNEPISFEMVA